MTDAFVREIVESSLTSIAEECGVVSARSAYSPAINEGADIACALFDADARLIAQTSSALIHVSAVSCMLPGVLEIYPPDELRPGDAVVTNDVFRGGIHPTDVAIFRPIFHDGRLAFFYGAMMIVSDLGGMSTGGLPANATECFHEGLMIPAVKLIRDGEVDPDVSRLIKANSRTPERVMGDILALAAGAHLAEPRLVELVDKHGYEDLLRIIDEVLDHSERQVRLAIERIPDRTYTGSYVIEPDGVEPGRHHPVHLSITIEGSSCTMDFSGTGPRARGAINATYSQSLSACLFAMRCVLGGDVPWNEGIYRPFDVQLPPGSLVNAQHPAATNIRMETVHAIMDAIVAALSDVFPEQAGASSAEPFVFTASGTMPGTGERWSLLDLNMGTVGARSTKDGVDGSAETIYSTSSYGRSVEGYEIEYPVVYWCHRLEPDSGGPGRWRGGAGVRKEVEFLTDVELTVRAHDRFVTPPQGAAGGRPGGQGGWYLGLGSDDERSLPPKQTNIVIPAGEQLTMVVAGGGGYGDPFERDPKLVADDVRGGLVSLDAARGDYGVVIDAATGEPDVVATRRERRGRR